MKIKPSYLYLNYIILTISLLFISQYTFTQDQPSIRSMEWGSNLKINLKLSNDSTYALDVDQLHHANQRTGQQFNNYTYYPARLSEEFIHHLQEIKINRDQAAIDSIQDTSDKTLWSALHHLIGGGWAHFLNTILFALEKDYLSLTDPLMQRPETNWKPKPMTESYRRTKKWDYYAPVHQRHAQKEYNLRKQQNELGGLKDVPEDFVNLFQETGNWQYKRMLKKGEEKKLAKIDLVKLLLGAKFLGEAQIEYIRTMVMKAINDYAKHELPSVIIFSNFNAAVAMSLNEEGYQVEHIVFSDEKEISDSLKQARKKKIKTIVQNINEVNQSIFQKRLKQYYN